MERIVNYHDLPIAEFHVMMSTLLKIGVKVTLIKSSFSDLQQTNSFIKNRIKGMKRRAQPRREQQKRIGRVLEIQRGGRAIRVYRIDHSLLSTGSLPDGFGLLIFHTFCTLGCLLLAQSTKPWTDSMRIDFTVRFGSRSLLIAFAWWQRSY